MKTGLGMVAALLLLVSAASAQPGFQDRPITENAFAPTGYTLHKQEFTIGIGPVHYGITENFQVGTNLLFWLVQVSNADAKIAFSKSDRGAFAVGLAAYRLSLDVSGDEESIDFTELAPYGALSFRLSENNMAHLGAQYAWFNAKGDWDVKDAEASASASGTSVFAGLEHTMTQRTKFMADVGYDATFEGMRFSGGVMFAWERFHLKLGVSYFDAGEGFTLPLVGLWWRFKA
jgi:hypothetical protein